ncbi:MAG: hypothetical protein IT204_00745 [Fimbriimonadaceae bacterium]|nr:hypothetical protein [Fimbriimonadaceae bacterium]
MMRRDKTIHAWLDQRLSPGERERFAERLAAEPELAATAEEARRVQHLLRALPVDQPPADLADNIMRQIRTAPAPMVRRWAWWQPSRAMMLAGATVAVLAAVMLVPRDETATLAATQLTETDRRFVQECLRDYHYEVSTRLAGSGAAQRAADATLEF